MTVINKAHHKIGFDKRHKYKDDLDKSYKITLEKVKMINLNMYTQRN